MRYIWVLDTSPGDLQVVRWTESKEAPRADSGVRSCMLTAKGRLEVCLVELNRMFA